MTDYTTPITVNGVSCHNCSDVDRARLAQVLGVDPSRIGPGGEIKPKADTSQSGVNTPLTTGVKGRVVNLLT